MAEVTTKGSVSSDVFDVLRSTVVKIDPKDRFCILLFDEFGLDVGSLKKSLNEKPTHVVSFFLRGIETPWKQPISNIFWRRQGQGQQLAEMIKSVVNNVLRTGLTIVASVSDHSQLNVDAIAHLCKQTTQPNTGHNSESYIVACNKIHHIYDPCRLLTAVRNKLIKHRLMFEMNGHCKTASWRHIIKMFAVDRARGQPHQLPKLTYQHLHSDLMDKKVTSLGVQVFSETVATEIIRTIAIGKIEPEARDTADLLLFYDKLFDSCNGDIENVKPLRSALKVGSSHFQLWNEAETILDSQRFIYVENGQIFRPICLDKWLVAITGICNVWKTVKKYKIKQVMTRIFNLDVLHNMMQIIRLANSMPAEIYCEPTDGHILDQRVLRLVMGENDGYFEVK